MGIGRQVSVTKRRAVFLDRDGVINRAVVRESKPYPSVNVDEIRILPGVPKETLQAIPDRPIFFGVLPDEFPEIERQAMEISG